VGIKIANLDKVGLILWAFIIILIGVVLIQAIADSVYEARTLSDTVNESIAIVSGAGTTANADLTSLSFFGRGNISTHVEGITITEEVNWTTAGGIIVNPDNFSDDSYNISYGFEGTGYVTNATARTLLGLIIIFFAIAIIIVGYQLVTRSFSDLF